MTADDIRKADESLRNFAGKAVKSACYAPFVSLYLSTTGDVQACCRNQTFILGDLRKQRLAEIWNGGRIAALRNALTDYRFNLGCEYCEWESKRRGDSFAIRLMSDHFPLASPQPEWPAVIEFNGSNTCNLECIMCCGENSSSIRGNIEGLPPLPRIYNDQFFDDLRPFLPHLHFINFLGGEPFLATEMHRIWDMMIDGGLLIPCRVTTNGTQYNARVERVLNALPMHITVSLDGVTKETYEKVRHRANFETVIANLHRFDAYTRERGTNFGISYCLMRQNWREVGDIALFAEQLNCELSIVMVAGPSHCTLFTLPPHELRAIVDAIVKMSDTVLPQLGRHRKAWEELIQQLRAATETVQLQKIEKLISYELVTDTSIAAARRFTSKGDYPQALQKLQEIQPGHTDYYYALALSGYIRGRQGDLEGAMKDLRKALQLSRKLPDAYLNLARIQFRQGEFDAALESAHLARERAAPEERIEALVLVLLGLIYAHKWRLILAYRTYARLAALPQPSRDGVTLPDSLDGARRCLAELETGDGKFPTGALAFWAHALYRWAVACKNSFIRVRGGPLIRNILGLSQAGEPISPGQAVLSLLPANAKRRARWSLRVAGADNRALLGFPPDALDSARIDIRRAGSGVSHDIQLNYALIEFGSDRVYSLRFRVRADEPRQIGFGIAKAVGPWTNLGLYRTREVNTSWEEIQEEFVSGVAEQNGRVHFDLGSSGISVELSSLAVIDLGARPSDSGNSSALLQGYSALGGTR